MFIFSVNFFSVYFWKNIMSITNNQSSSNPKTLNFFWNDTRHPPEKRFKAATKYLTQKLKSFEEQNFENLSDFLRNIPKFLVLSISSEKDQLRVRDYRKILQNCWPNWQEKTDVKKVEKYNQHILISSMTPPTNGPFCILKNLPFDEIGIFLQTTPSIQSIGLTFKEKNISENHNITIFQKSCYLKVIENFLPIIALLACEIYEFNFEKIEPFWIFCAEIFSKTVVLNHVSTLEYFKRFGYFEIFKETLQSLKTNFSFDFDDKNFEKTKIEVEIQTDFNYFSENNFEKIFKNCFDKQFHQILLILRSNGLEAFLKFFKENSQNFQNFFKNFENFQNFYENFNADIQHHFYKNNEKYLHQETYFYENEPSTADCLPQNSNFEILTENSENLKKENFPFNVNASVFKPKIEEVVENFQIANFEKNIFYEKNENFGMKNTNFEHNINYQNKNREQKNLNFNHSDSRYFTENFKKEISDSSLENNNTTANFQNNFSGNENFLVAKNYFEQEKVENLKKNDKNNHSDFNFQNLSEKNSEVYRTHFGKNNFFTQKATNWGVSEKNENINFENFMKFENLNTDKWSKKWSEKSEYYTRNEWNFQKNTENNNYRNQYDNKWDDSKHKNRWSKW